MSGLANVGSELKEQISNLDEQLGAYQKKAAELDTSYGQLQERTRELQDAKPKPTPNLTDWGSIAASMAIFAASSSSRKPLVAGLQAGAAALEASRRNNAEQYAANLEGWYTNMQFALKQEELAAKTMNGIMQAQNTTTQQKIAALRAVATTESMQQRIATGDMRVIARGLAEHKAALERFSRLQDTMLKQGQKFISDKLAAGELTPEQAQEEFGKLRTAIEQMSVEDPSRTAFRDWQQSLGVAGPKVAVSVQKQEAQNQLARSANEWYASEASKQSGAKWKHPVTGVEYTRKQMQQAKEGIKGAMPKEIEDLSRVFEARPLPGGTALPRAQAEGGPAQPKTLEEYNALPKGALFIDPDDGKTYRKP